MKKILFFLVLMSFSGCAHGKGFSLFKAQVADEVKVADKVTGIESVKMADKAEAENVMGSGSIDKSQTSTSVGGNMSNDSEVIKNMIKANAKLNEKILDNQKNNAKSERRIYWGIIIYLLGMLKYNMISRSKLIKKLLKNAEAEEAREDIMQKRLLDIALKNKEGV